MDPEQRKWLSNDEVDQVEKELVAIFPLPSRRSQRSTIRSVLCSDQDMALEPLPDESDDDDDDVFCTDKFAAKLGFIFSNAYNNQFHSIFGIF